MGDQLDDEQDVFNDDTFGGGPSIGKDFDFFGNTAQVSDVINEEQLRYTLQHSRSSAPLAPSELTQIAATTSQKPKKTGYERYQEPGYIPEIQAKSSVWGTSMQKTPATSVIPAGPSSRKVLSLEEVEAQMRNQFHHPAQSQPSSDPPQHALQAPLLPEAYGYLPSETASSDQQGQFAPPGDLNSQLLQRLQQMPPELPQGQPSAPIPPGLPPQLSSIERSRQPSHQQLPATGHGQNSTQPLPVISTPLQLMNLTEEQRQAYLEEDAKRAKRNHKIFLLSKGNGLMTPQDKNFITRIQLQQLIAATGNVNEPDPEALLSEDFYYQVYSQIRGAPRQHPRQPLGHFAQTYLFQTGNRPGGHGRRQYQNADNHMQRMQQQVQRAVEAAKLKPKNKQLIIEGSLGKISFSNAKTPKPLLNIKKPENVDGLKVGKKAASTDLSPSDRKSILSNIESVYATLMKMEDLERTMPPPPQRSDSEAIQKHIEWRQKMQLINQKLWEELKVMEPIVPGSSIPHPFIAFLSYPKGKKAIPRIFRHIDQEQRVTILTMLVVHLDSLDVVRKGQLPPGETQPPVVVREEIDLFSQAVMPSLLGYVSEAPLNIIIGLLGLVLAQTHVHTIAKTKVGLGILTMLLSRAEIVKEAGQAEERDWQQWVENFNQLFDIMEPILPDVFPGTINTGEDMYVWQFLAAVGIGANPEQQQRLVIAVKYVSLLSCLYRLCIILPSFPFFSWLVG